MDSILTTIKTALGIPAEDTSFDAELIIHINSVINALAQIGIGPKTGFIVTGSTETWNDYIQNDLTKQMIKTYMYLKVRLIFDPPSSSFVLESYNKQIAEYEWRLQTQKETLDDNTV